MSPLDSGGVTFEDDVVVKFQKIYYYLNLIHEIYKIYSNDVGL
jgi:hypothetical protein